MNFPFILVIYLIFSFQIAFIQIEFEGILITQTLGSLPNAIIPTESLE